MTPPESEPGASCPTQDWFPTTHWSVVLAAGELTSQRAELALESLCRAYWQPLYSFIRRLGHSPVDAQDLTQSFLASLLARRSFQNLHPHNGRFRSFLLASLKNFLADQWDKVRAQKRGGHVTLLSLDAVEAERCYALEPAETRDPAMIFDRRWALTLLNRVMQRLEADMTRGGKAAQWQSLKGYLIEDADAPPYAELAERFQLSLSAVKMSVSRLRQRYGELLRAEIAVTVSSPAEIDEELRYLLTVLRR